MQKELIEKLDRLSENDLIEILNLCELRDKYKPNLSLKEFIYLMLYASELNFLSDEAYQGFKKFYEKDEIIKDRIENLGKILSDKEPETSIEDPIEWMIVEFLNKYYSEKFYNTVAVKVRSELLSEITKLATEEELKKIGIEINRRINVYLQEFYKKLKEKSFRRRLRAS